MNYYEILKISTDADEGEIKKAYKNLVKKYHPDLYLADKEFAEKRIKEINEAYRILIDKESRLEYDEYLNETSQETTQNVINEQADYKKEEYSQDSIQEKFSLSNWVFKKFDNLNKATQIKVFLIFILIILLILLNNIMKLKNNFEKKANIIDNSVIDKNTDYQNRDQNKENNYYDSNDNNNNNNYYYYDDELQSQFIEFYNTLLNECKNTIVGE